METVNGRRLLIVSVWNDNETENMLNGDNDWDLELSEEADDALPDAKV